MRLLKICILIVVLICPAMGQNMCGAFKDYRASQNWVKEIIESDPEQRKTKILERIKCEQHSNPTDIDFWLTILIDGIIVSTANEIPQERNKILELVSANNIDIAHSLCETEGVYPQRCNLGLVIFSGLDGPILNESNQLKDIYVERKKTKIIIKLVSKKKAIIDLQALDFFRPDTHEKNKKVTMKKGRNKIVIATDQNIKLITIEENGQRIIVLK